MIGGGAELRVMAQHGSTTRNTLANRGWHPDHIFIAGIGGLMVRWLFVAVLLVILAAAVGFLALGAFPTEPHPVSVHKVMPNDRVGQGM